MVLEDDSLNYQHLLDVSLPALLVRYINERLHRGHNVCPVEDTCNTLAVALFWHMTSQGPWMIVPHLLPFGESVPLLPLDALNGESIDSRERMMAASISMIHSRCSISDIQEVGLSVQGAPSGWHSYRRCSTAHAYLVNSPGT